MSHIQLLRQNFFKPKTWLYGLLLFLCAWMLMLMMSVISLLSGLQFISLLCTGKPHHSLTELGYILHKYTSDLIAYLTFQRSQPPFPFS